ncbi:transglutaminase-like domain-containing protein [Dactylosporangium aurantiacum]|uniref:transglutaminase-like domain-containing protein n=1 Tax=Dactylosporangium aurantiacum TaxID=35754 RepID=UPI00052487D8|nr:transglutaminase family protein [Dactylosporangium aurantiacum]MDG6101609.1 transglutaminase family protein [Dactylosporangium aurantiacum]
MVDARVGSTLEFQVREPAELQLMIAVSPGPGVTAQETLDARLDGEPVAVTPVAGGHWLRVGTGLLRVEYTAEVTVRRGPPPRLELAERITATRPSRYCPSDRLAGFAAREFERFAPSRADTVAGIVDYVHRHIRYEAGASTGTTDAAETLLSGAGVCRDFAHLVVALARAVNIPARTVAVYAPGLSPMDFHAVAEVAVDGEWRVVDATGLAPRQSMVRIATGADAAETAFAGVLSGTAELTSMQVRAVTAGDLPVDDGHGVVHLP